MIQLIPKTNIDFVGKRYVFFAISGVLLLSGLASLIMKGGPKWGLDFTGGTLVETRFDPLPSSQEIRDALTKGGIASSEIQTVPAQGIVMIRTQVEGASISGNASEESKNDLGRKIQTILEQSFPANKPVLLRKEFVGPTVGKHLFKETALAFVLTFIGIIIYVAFRFHSGVWGAAGVIALVHDVFATIGIFSLMNKEISVTVVAALLTIAGYSINDTIVIFDFMREKLRLLRTEPLDVVINVSVNDTLSRTIITNFTVFLVVLTLFFFGGEVIHDFAFAMLFGAIVGTYSTIGIASPIIYEWTKVKSRKK